VDTLLTPEKDKPSNRSEADLLAHCHKSTQLKSMAIAMPNSADPTTFPSTDVHESRRQARAVSTSCAFCWHDLPSPVKNPWLRWRFAFWATRWSIRGIQQVSCPRHRRAVVDDTAVVVGDTAIVGATAVVVGDTSVVGATAVVVGDTAIVGATAVVFGDTGIVGATAVVVGDTGVIGATDVVVGDTGVIGATAVVVGDTAIVGATAVVVGDTAIVGATAVVVGDAALVGAIAFVVGDTAIVGATAVVVGDTSVVGATAVVVGDTAIFGATAVVFGDAAVVGATAVVVGDTGVVGATAVVVGDTSVVGATAVVVGDIGVVGVTAVVVGDIAVVGTTVVVGATMVVDNDDAHGSVPPPLPLSKGRDISRQGRTFPLAVHFDIGGAGRSVFFGREVAAGSVQACFDARVADFWPMYRGAASRELGLLSVVQRQSSRVLVGAGVVRRRQCEGGRGFVQPTTTQRILGRAVNKETKATWHTETGRPATSPPLRVQCTRW